MNERRMDPLISLLSIRRAPQKEKPLFKSKCWAAERKLCRPRLTTHKKRVQNKIKRNTRDWKTL
jgi:hypothetical protein